MAQPILAGVTVPALCGWSRRSESTKISSQYGTHKEDCHGCDLENGRSRGVALRRSYKRPGTTAPVLTTLYNFMGSTDGGEPAGGVVPGGGGVLYGAAQLGGPADGGLIFSLTPPTTPGNPWTEAVI